MHILFIVSLTSIIGMVSCNPTSFAVHFSSITFHDKEIPVEYVGSVGNWEMGLTKCQGDCATDDDCLGDLKCFQRENGDPCPPGCSGDCELYANGRRDFCFDPSDAVQTSDEFIVSDYSMGFEDAESWCNDRGGHLVSIHSDEENAAAYSLCPHCWLGMHSVSIDHGNWKWTDGTATDYFNWNPNEPNDEGGDEDCTEMRAGPFWNDLACDKKNRALCSVFDRDEHVLGLRLYYEDSVLSCHLKITDISQVVETTYFCNVNNMVEMTRCDDGMGDIAIELENPTAHYDLNIESFYIRGGELGDNNILIPANDADNDTHITFVLEPGAITTAYIDGSKWTITDIDTREGAAQGLENLVISTGVISSLFDGMAPLDVELSQKDSTNVNYLYHCHHLVPNIAAAGDVPLYWPDDMPGSATYFYCGMTGHVSPAWTRYICPNHTEGWTLRSDSTTLMAIDSVSGGSSVDSFCIPDKKYDWENIANGWWEEDQCECDIRWLPLGWYPVVNIENKNSCGGSQNIVSAAYHYYTLLVTTCVGSEADNIMLNVLAKGSNGNTINTLIGRTFDQYGGPESTRLWGNGATTSHGIGSQDIGDLIFIEIAVNNPWNLSNNICLKQLEWVNNRDSTRLVLGEEYLGNGVFLVNDGYPWIGRSNTNRDSLPPNMFACDGPCDSDNDCKDDLVCIKDRVPNGCLGETGTSLCGHTDASLKVTDLSKWAYRESPFLEGLYLPSTPHRFQINTMSSATLIDLVLHLCASNDAFTLKDDSKFEVSVSGRHINGQFESTESLSLSTGQAFNAGSSRKYALLIPAEFTEINVLSFSQNTANDMICIDMVEVNGKEAYLTETYLSAAGSDCEGLVEPTECPSVLFAVLTWPICGIQIMSTRTESTVQSKSNEQVVAAKCSNPNRLFETECAVSEERSTATSYETTVEISTSRSTSRSNSFSMSAGGSATTTTGWSFQSETGLEIGNDKVGKSTQKFTSGSSGSVSISSTWSGSSSSSWTAGTEDSTANGDSNSTSSSSSVSCSGSVSVPPLHSVSYTVIMANAIVDLTTYSDIRMTKCSAAFQDALSNESLYIYLYDVPGASRSVSGDSCSVEYATAEYKSAPMDCDEATKMTNVELGTHTYVPVCNRTNPAIWEPCQCGYGDSRTEANCICVDKDSGVPLAKDDGFGAAVIDTSDASDYDHYSDWCEEHCPNTYYPGILQKKGISAASSDMVTLLLPDSECEGPSCHGSNSSPDTQFDFMDSETMATLIYLAMAALCAVFVVSTVATTAILISVCGKLCPPYRKSQMIAVDQSDCV